MDVSNVSDVLAAIKSLTANPPQDAAVRDELYHSVRKLSAAIEETDDTVDRIVNSPMVLTMALVASNLDLFVLLTKKSSSTVKELAETTSCDPVLLGRILRFLASHELVAEVSEDTFAANRVTHVFTNPGYQAGLRHNSDLILPCLDKFPQFLKDSKYTNPNDAFHGAFQVAHNTDQPAFVYAMSVPEKVANFGLWMSSVHNTQHTWLDVFDLSKHCEGSDDSTAVFVDIAGGTGQQCALVKQKLPHMRGRVILQEIPPTLAHALNTPGVENMVVDMWQGQSVKGAKAYYLRNVLHDYPDDRCIDLLKKTVEAMSPESVILIDEMIVPNTGARPRVTNMDVTMMTALSAMERTESQWEALLKAAGLKALAKDSYRSVTGQSLIVAVPRQ